MSAWNRYLERAVWLWSTDQARRYRDHVWRDLYDWRWAMELHRHPEAETVKVTRRDGVAVEVERYTLGHCESRAMRWLGSQLLEYVYGLWTAGLTGNPETWYRTSHWPALFSQAERELTDGLGDYLAVERDRRAKVQVES